MKLTDQIQEVYHFIRQKIGHFRPQTAIVLGSSFGYLANLVHIKYALAYDQIPQFPRTTVQGHAGRLIFGSLENHPVVMMQGRFHYYEGHSMQTLSIPVKVFKQLGIKTLVLTNAAGAVNPKLKPGDLLIIEDHINFSLQNPLIGPNLPQFGIRFPDTSATYAPVLIKLGKETAQALNMSIRTGVYLFTSGPNYETPAEIRMMQHLGADVVGMSTFPEAISAAHTGTPVFGLSMVSNYGAGLGKQPLSHQEVLEAMESEKIHVEKFFQSFISKLEL